MQATIESLLGAVRPMLVGGKPAGYIPALARVSPDLLGIAVTGSLGETIWAGDATHRFTIQSISKPLTLAYVIETVGEEAVFSRVGMEPTGDPFNSIVRLETSGSNKPFNPLINAGAIVVSSLLPGDTPMEQVDRLCAFIGKAVGRADVAIDPEVYASEKETGARNRSIAWFLRELGLLDGDVEAALDAYFRHCSILLDAVELSRIGALFAFGGKLPDHEKNLISPRTARIVRSLMMTCGLYNGSGEFALRAGVPAKSGVGGGIVAAPRDRMGIGVFGPALNAQGNSLGGVELICRLSERFELAAL